MRDLKNNIYVSQLRAVSDDAATDAYSNYVDLAEYEGCVVGFACGAAAGTLSSSVYLTPTLQECDTTVSASFTAVAAADVEGAFTVIDAAAEDECIQWVGYKGRMRYVRLFLNYTGATGAWYIGVFAIMGYPKVAPAAAPTTGTAS